MSAIFEIYRYWYTDLLFEVEFCLVGGHLLDESHKFASVVSKGIVMCLVFSSFDVMVSFESWIIVNNIVSCIHEGVVKSARALLGHSRFLSLIIIRLRNWKIQYGEGKQFTWCRAEMDFVNLANCHSAIYRSDVRNGHNYKVQAGERVCHYKFCI